MFSLQAEAPSPCPTNSISIKFAIRPKFEVLWFKMHSTDHNEILHTSRQLHCPDMCKLPFWISNSIEIPLVGWRPVLQQPQLYFIMATLCPTEFSFGNIKIHLHFPPFIDMFVDDQVNHNNRSSTAMLLTYHQTSNISCTLVGNKIDDHSDVIRVSPVGTAPTTSSFSI